MALRRPSKFNSTTCHFDAFQHRKREILHRLRFAYPKSFPGPDLKFLIDWFARLVFSRGSLRRMLWHRERVKGNAWRSIIVLKPRSTILSAMSNDFIDLFKRVLRKWLGKCPKIWENYRKHSKHPFHLHKSSEWTIQTCWHLKQGH